MGHFVRGVLWFKSGILDELLDLGLLSKKFDEFGVALLGLLDTRLIFLEESFKRAATFLFK